MSIKKTLGGDRLGAGKKMQVELHNYERSTHDLGYIFRSSMSAGTLVPFMCKVALPGDTFDINLSCEVSTHPTIGPLFSSFKVQLDTFLAPMRLYNALLHNNMVGIGMNMSQVKFPVLEMITPAWTDKPEDYSNSQINPSCVLAYLGIRGIGEDQGAGGNVRLFNAIPYLAYCEIYKNYYANKQEEKGAVIHTPTAPYVKTVTSVSDGLGSIPDKSQPNWTQEAQGTVIFFQYTGATPIASTLALGILEEGEVVEVSIENLMTNIHDNPGLPALQGTLTEDTQVMYWTYISEQSPKTVPPQIETFDLSDIDEMREKILSFHSKTTPYVIDADPVNTPQPYYWMMQGVSGTNGSALCSQEGLLLKTYQSDMFNNWLSTAWIDGVNGISQVTAVSTVGDEFTLDALNLARKVYNMLNRIAVSGGTANDWIEAVYGHEAYTKAESPMYMGGLSRELVFQEVVSNTASSEGAPMGTLAGKGVMAKKHKGGRVRIKVDEPSYIMGLVSITPRIDYSQGNSWDVHLKTMDDLHKPALDQIGFQDLITEKMAWWTTNYQGGWVQRAAGKQPAWIDYMTSVNQTYGSFAIENSEMFMTLNRRYEQDGNTPNIADLTTYIDPSKYNNIFAETALDAQNFWTQIGVDITARRKMSAKVMPNV